MTGRRAASIAYSAASDLGVLLRLIEAVVDRQIGRLDADLGQRGRRRYHCATRRLDIGQVAGGKHRLELDRERGFAGMGGGKIEQADIHPEGTPGFEAGVERPRGAAENASRGNMPSRGTERRKACGFLISEPMI